MPKLDRDLAKAGGALNTFGGRVMTSKKDSTFDPLIIIESLSSCAIEGNRLAVDLLALRDKNPREFWRQVYKIFGQGETSHDSE